MAALPSIGTGTKHRNIGRTFVAGFVVAALAVMPVCSQNATTATAASDTDTTGSASLSPIPSPEPLNRGYGMPDWFEAATRADDFRETPTVPVVTKPLSAAEPILGNDLATTAIVPQPAGFLTGRVVFLMAGHGWTYSREAMSWYTQRGVNHGMVEDFGNHDQMCIFAHMAYQAGATIVPLRPVDRQPEERIVDDSSAAHAEFYGPWAKSDSTISHYSARGASGYRFAIASLEETAVARFRPNIAVPGDYPVYAWVRDGVDRVNQLYRVRHAGGIAEVRVNHRMVGKGLVWLGTFPFDRGTSGFVEISTKVSDPYEADGRHVVIADGVRFGNGRGDVNRGGGISGWNREHEGDCYWIERGLGPSADPRIFIADGGDGNSTVMAPPRSSAYMNRETEGRYADRFYLSFHSNAATGRARGAVALWNKSEILRPDFQEILAYTSGAWLSRELEGTKLPGLPNWQSRSNPTSNWITFGELRKDYIQNEMCTTIMEVAFHDNAEDAALLLDPRMRRRMAAGTLRGFQEWLRKVDPAASNMVAPPPVPTGLTAAFTTGTTARLTWTEPTAETLTQAPAQGYRILASLNGRGFTPLAEVGPGHAADVILPSTGTTFLRLHAWNAGGESEPSETAVVRFTEGAPKALIVNGFSSLDPAMNFPERADGGLGSGIGPGGTWTRVRPRQANSGAYSVSAAEAFAESTCSLDYANGAAIADGRVKLDGHDLVVWQSGGQLPSDGILTTGSLVALRDYLREGGHLFLSGQHVVSGLDASHPDFVREYLGVRPAEPLYDLGMLEIAGDEGLAATTSTIEDGTGPGYRATPHDTLESASPQTRILASVRTTTGTAPVAAEHRHRVPRGSVVVMSVPIEAVTDSAARRDIMTRVMLGMVSKPR